MDTVILLIAAEEEPVSMSESSPEPTRPHHRGSGVEVARGRGSWYSMSLPSSIHHQRKRLPLLLEHYNGDPASCKNFLMACKLYFADFPEMTSV